MTELAPSARASDWYADWQHQTHAELFDGRAALDRANLVRNYESFNDVLMLKERLDPARDIRLLEIGCATAEFSRYLHYRYPAARYYGVDISHTAIARARQKYPSLEVAVSDPSTLLQSVLGLLGLDRQPEIVYSKDVMHHQADPFGWLSQLLRLAGETLIVRTRTRDVGPTERNPEQSCQYHYQGWMPYIVLNLEELLAHIRQGVPDAEIVAYRHYMILGGRENRLLPKACYLSETGTAETAVGIFLNTRRPGTVTLLDRRESDPVYTLGYRLKMRAGRIFGRTC